ncbi:hypothetical protein PVAND_017153 [Polypedilum vanderplanki]|uniref:G-protein coupled receptors family 3 profile domain-containing protein n=1 Tax=Polypedilum vanderplanki TaxID=319348 RepID=A0A9J6BIL6_POLVA|nr:hypothetical protein PVAND_017153 [Polypedilum vanderplanki]
MLIFILLLLIAQSTTQNSTPKFGDRIGKLKRNFQISSSTVSTTTTTTAQPSTTEIDLKFNEDELTNDINRADNYFDMEEHENKRFMVLKDQKVSSPSSSLVQARFEMQTDFFDVPPSPLSSVYSTLPARVSSFNKSGVVLAARTPIHPTNITKLRHDIKTLEIQYGLRDSTWAIPVLVLSITSMLMMLAFEIFVLCKTRQTSPNRRHLFLGQMLLLGLFTCVGLSALLTARPSTLSCGTVRFAAGVGFAIIFASLLVKCIFLISLNSGVYLPAPYQALLLFFAVLIQITIDIQWLLTSPPAVHFLPINEISHPSRLIFTADSMKFSIQVCKTSFSELRLSMIYIDLLIIIVAILAVKSRGIRDNYREATYIGLAIALIIPVWLGWSLIGMAVHERHKDACLAFALLATSTIVFLVMFMPKGRQLAAMGREDLFVEDRDDRFSASSRAGSGYSPSFFHFKPIKYGMMGGKGNLGSNEISSKHQQAVTTLGGDYALYVPMSYYTPPMHNYSHHHHHHMSPLYYYSHKQPPPHYAGLFMQDDANAYTTLEQTMSSNPNVFFQRQVHPGMIY